MVAPKWKKKSQTAAPVHGPSTEGAVEVHASTAGLGVIPSAEGMPRVRNAEVLMADKTLKMPKELVRGVLHKGTRGVLAGPPKSGKSWAALDLGMSVATGTRWLNWDTSKGKVLYLNYEIMEASFVKRMRAVKTIKAERHGDLDFSDFDILTMRGVTTPLQAVVERLFAQSKGGYSLIVIDPLYKAIGGGKQNSAGAVEQLCGWLNTLSKDTGTAVLVVHHFMKGKQTNKPLLARFGGSVVITQDADTIIGLTEHPEENCFNMEFELRNFEEQQAVVVERRPPQFIIREDLDPELVNGQVETKKEDKLDVVLDLLGAKGLTASQWEERALAELDMPRATFFRRKKDLVKVEKVKLDDESKCWRKTG